MLQTEDGGFLVTGGTFGSGVTGNKSNDGNGIWLLKLNNRGIKEAEMLFPTTVSRTPKLLPAPGGYRQVASGWIADILPPKIARLGANAAGKPFNVHVSSDLLHWAPLVVNSNGTLSLAEPIDASRKFYRAADAP